MSNEYKDLMVDRCQDMETCLCKLYKDLNILYKNEMKNEEPNQVIVDLIVKDQKAIEKAIGFTEKDIMG